MTLAFDSATALDRVDNDRELLIELIDLASSDALKKLSILEAAIQKKEFDVINKTAHSMKSAFGNVGAMQCFELSFELEKKGKTSQIQDTPEIMEKLKRALELFQAEAAAFKRNG